MAVRFATVVAALALPSAGAVKLEELTGFKRSPVFKAIDLVAKLEANIVADGKVEQQSYDKYMCWCEDAFARKGDDMDAAKKTLDVLGRRIPKLMAEIASHSAKVQQMEKDIAANLDAQKEASSVRNKENNGYETGKAESENSIGALEAAINALSGAGEKKNFLETSKQAQLITVAAGMKTVLDRDGIASKTSAQDMETLRRFVQEPSDFLTGSPASALQMGSGAQRNNPAGDYAPQSTQIQGILKGLYDGFVSDMEKEHGEEADKQKAFEELMATKKQELADLQSTYETHETDKANRVKELADDRMERDDTKEQLEADTQFVAETKEGCQRKAKEWAMRSRLRTEELMGIGEGLKILRDPKNQAIFSKSSGNLVQLSSATSSGASVVARRQRRAGAVMGVRKAYQRLMSMAENLHSFSLARLAVQAKLGGHFDKVMATIDNRVEDLRKEEKDDIEHRDRCERSEAKNSAELEDLTRAADKNQDHIDTMKSQIVDLRQKVSDLEGEIKTTDLELAEVLRLRNEAHDEFKQGLKDDTMAADIIRKAVSAMAEFYKKNQEAMALLQGTADPEYTVDKDKAPETTWDSGSYGGRKSQSKGALGALEMVVSDIEKEIEVSRKDDKEAQAQFEKDRAALVEVRDANEKAKVEAEKKAAALKEDQEGKEEEKTEIAENLSTQTKLKATVANDCGWVKTHFDSRKTARKAEIDGLQEAKSLLAGADQGDFDEMSLTVS